MNNFIIQILETMQNEKYNRITHTLGRRNSKSYIKYYIATYYELFKRLKNKQKNKRLKLKKRNRKGFK